MVGWLVGWTGAGGLPRVPGRLTGHNTVPEPHPPGHQPEQPEQPEQYQNTRITGRSGHIYSISTKIIDKTRPGACVQPVLSVMAIMAEQASNRACSALEVSLWLIMAVLWHPAPFNLVMAGYG